MKNENYELINELANERLDRVLNDDLDSETEERYFKQAMTALDKSNNYEETQVKCLNTLVKFLEVVGCVCLVPLGTRFLKSRDMKKLCEFEKADTLTTTAGREISRGLFK